MRRLDVMVLAGLAVVIAVAVAVMPQLDLAVARRFYDGATHQFPLGFDPVVNWLRDRAMLVVLACAAAPVAALIVKLMVPARPMFMSGRAIIFLLVTLALGPGVVANGFFKKNWSRPRPAEVTEFGGTRQFVPWWSPNGTCDTNCSFVSGEVATAAWTLAPAILVPAPARYFAIAAAGAFTLGLGALRIAVGGHFVSDVVFAVVVTGLIIWMAYGLLFRWPRRKLDDAAIDRALTRLALGLRRHARGLFRLRS